MIFVDSSYWIAQLLDRDAHHARAKILESEYSRAALLTSSAVIAESWTYLRRKAGHPRTIVWLDQVEAAPRLTVERIGHDLEREAWAWLRVHDERPYSFADATSFALMRRLRITEALAFDGDFAAAGFTELRP